MPAFLHTMVRITDPEKSRAFYEALGFRFERDMDIVRNGEIEATNYFYGIGDEDSVLELTYNHDGRTYELGTGYGHIAVGVDDLEQTLAQLKQQGIKPERDPYRLRDGGSLLCFVRDPDSWLRTSNLRVSSSRQLRRPVEVAQNLSELVEPPGVGLPAPLDLDFADGFTDGTDGVSAS